MQGASPLRGRLVTGHVGPSVTNGPEKSGHGRVLFTFHYAKDSGNFGRNLNGDRNIRDHLWRWSTYFGWNIPTEIRCSIFDKPILFPN